MNPLFLPPKRHFSESSLAVPGPLASLLSNCLAARLGLGRKGFTYLLVLQRKQWWQAQPMPFWVPHTSFDCLWPVLMLLCWFLWIPRQGRIPACSGKCLVCLGSRYNRSRVAEPSPCPCPSVLPWPHGQCGQKGAGAGCDGASQVSGAAGGGHPSAPGNPRLQTLTLFTPTGTCFVLEEATWGFSVPCPDHRCFEGKALGPGMMFCRKPGSDDIEKGTWSLWHYLVQTTRDADYQKHRPGPEIQYPVISSSNENCSFTFHLFFQF